MAQRYGAPARGLQATVVPGPSSNVPGEYIGADTQEDGTTGEWYGEERRHGPPARWWQQGAGGPGRAARQHLAGGPRRGTGTWPALLPVPCDRDGNLVDSVPSERQEGDAVRRFFVRASRRWRAAPSKRRPAGTHLPHGHPGDRGGAGRASSQPAREQAAGAGPPGIDGRHCPMRGFGSLAGAARFGSAHDGDYRPSPPRGMPPVTHSGTTFPSGQGVDCQSVPCLPRPSNPHISRGSREHEGRWPRMPAERRICTIGCGEWRTGPNDVGTEQKHCSRALPLPPLACGRRVPGGQRWCFPCWEPHTRLGLAPK